MHGYGSLQYWNERYEEEESSPFDWLVSLADVRELVDGLMPRKDSAVLVIGCGNANFSADLGKAGYTDITNVDMSSVVIQQQAERYPEQRWLCEDVRDMSFDADSFDVVLDKSVLDSLLCYENSGENTDAMIAEVFRVLRPGGRYLCISLHALDDIVGLVPKDQGLRVTAGCIRNPRWNAFEESKRSVSHSVLVVDKPQSQTAVGDDGGPPVFIPQCLTDKELRELREEKTRVNTAKALQRATLDEITVAFEAACDRFFRLSTEASWGAPPPAPDDDDDIDDNDDDDGGAEVEEL